MLDYGLENLICQVKHNKNINYSFELSNYNVEFVSNEIFRIHEYEFPIVYDFKPRGGRLKKFKDWSGDDDMEVSKYRKKTESRIIHRIYGLANCNFTNNDKFVSLVPARRIVDVKEGYKYFQDFIIRMREDFGYFKYLSVTEFQNKSLDNGRIHFHVLWDLPYIPQKQLLKKWGHGGGSVYIRKIFDNDNLGAYLLKYMGKSIGDSRLNGQKAYLCSQGLNRPIKKRMSNEEFANFRKKFNLSSHNPVRFHSYISENYGVVTETEYNLKRC